MGERDELIDRLRHVTSEEVISTAANHDIHEAAVALAATHEEVERLRGLLADIVTAWEALPGGQQPIRAIERWLIEDMEPEIYRARAALQQGGDDA